MATLLNLQSRRKYSWWWDSHISPKNSKWLQDNLTDMDSKVKQMIKLIEEDADSFARRAEMYYKKRPELMKMVEEFYRAYRALAERYDHATGVIRQAHKTMTETFPNDLPLGDDSPVSSAPSEGDPHTPEIPHPIRAMFDPEELHNDALGLSPSNFHAIQKIGSAEGRVKKSLNFNIFEEKEKHSVNNGENHNFKSRVLSESERGSKYDREIIILKEAISKLEAEKEAGLLQYQGSLEKLSNLQKHAVRAQEDSIFLNERVSKAEADAQEALTKLEAEREASFLQHQKYTNTISNLEKSITLAHENANELSKQASKADTESQTLKADLTKVNAEKEAILHQYQQCLSTISSLEKTIILAQENAVEFSERASKDETQTQTLKENLTKLEAERDASLLQYQQCLNTISNLKNNITLVQENAVELSEQASKAENESQALKHSLSMLEAEKESIVAHNNELLAKLSVTEKKLMQVVDNTIKISDRASKAEADAQILKEDLIKVEAEREVSVQQYQQCLSLVSDLEKTITLAQENAVELSARASEAETESQTLKEDLTKVKAQREASLHQYHQCLNMISNLEKNITVAKENAVELNERANITETEIQAVKHALSIVEAEKEAICVHNNQLLAKLSDTERKLLQAEADTKNTTQQANKAEREVETHKQALCKITNEKDEATLQYQQCLETISNMEHKLLCAGDNAVELCVRASKAETESQTLKYDLTKVKAERDASLHQYHQCLNMISNLEKSIAISQENAVELIERASIAETESQAVKHAFSLLETEKEVVLGHNSQLLAKLSDTEKKLLQAEEDTKKITEQADKAENEVELLKRSLAKLTNEKEEAALTYQQCLETVSNLERELSCAQEDAQRLNIEISDGVLIIKGVEECCLHLETSNQSLQFELTSLEQKIETQNQELAEKQQEVRMLRISIQEEQTQFKDIELALQALQSQSHEELRSLTTELEKRAQVIKDLQLLNNGLQDEVHKAKEENKRLNKLNMSSALSIKTMQEELASLKEVTGKLQNEAELSMDQRSTLQQEIYHLNEVINDLDKKHQAVLEQVNSVGLNSECFGPAVKELQDENSKLNELYENERSEKVDLFKKLAIMDEHLEKNAVLENYISGLKVELEVMREKVRELEEMCQFYLGENSVLVLEKNTILSQLQITTDNLGKHSEKNTILENSLFEKSVELEGLEKRLKSLEVSWQLLDTEKAVLIIENESLAFELRISQRTIENLEKILTELEDKYKGLEQEKESSLCQVKELLGSLDVLNQEHSNVTQLNATRVADLESQLCFLQEESRQRKKELEIQLDEAFVAQTEIFNLKKCVKDVNGNYVSLLEQRQKLFETSELSKKLISELEHDKLKQQVEVKSLTDEINNRKARVYQVVKALDIDIDHSLEDKFVRDHTHMDHILGKIEDQKGYLSKSLDENQQLILENMILCTLFGQLTLDATNLETEKNTYDHELKIRSWEVLALLSDKQSLQEENYALSGEAISLSYLSLVFKNTVIEKFMELNVITEKVKGIEGDLKITEIENHQLKESLDKSQNELETARNVCEQLNSEVARETEHFHLKEMELLETERKLQTLQVKQMELTNLMEGLMRKFDEVNEIKEDQEKHIHRLSEENGAQTKEGERLRDMVQRFEAKLLTLQEEHEETKVREKFSSSLLGKWRTEAELWETEGTKFFNEMQASSIHGMLFAAKIHELSDACQNLEDKSASNVKEIEFLKERVDTIEGKKCGLEAQLDLCILGINSLDHSIASLENFTFQHLEVNKTDSEKEVKDIKLENHLQVEISEKLNENLNADMPDNFLSLQGLESRIKAIEKDLIERERLGHNPLKPAQEISEAGRETLPKDIMLDQESECSSYGISKREISEADSLMLKLWETTDQNGSIVKNDDKRRKRSSEILDKLEISKRFVDDPLLDNNKKIILERLGSDLQKLTVLQVVVEDLKRKVEITEKRKKGKGLEYDTVKDQLEESEEAITRLFDMNKKLTNTIKEDALTSKEKSAANFEQSGTIRNIVTEQARRGSENIGRLQLEVQKLQFLLLKFDDEKQSKGKTRNKARRKTRVVLHDYLYGGILRSSFKGKKGLFCACIRPSTKGD